MLLPSFQSKDGIQSGKQASFLKPTQIKYFVLVSSTRLRQHKLEPAVEGILFIKTQREPHNPEEHCLTLHHKKHKSSRKMLPINSSVYVK